MTQPPYGDQGGQWPGGGGDWQAPSDQTQYSGPQPPGYDQPQSYDQPGYEQPQQYDQYAQQPGYSDQYSAPPGGYPDQYSAPPAGYDPNAAGMMPPAPKQSNPVPWIIGGVAGVLVLVIVIIAGVLLVRVGGDSTGGGGTTGAGGDEGGGSSGKYTVAKVTNACDLVDPTVLEKWAKKEDKAPEHTENKSDYYSSLRCSARYKDDGDSYGSASMSLYASVSGPDSEGPKRSYESSEKSAKGQTGTGRESGDISGLGEDAFFASYVNESEYSTAVTYDLGVLDGNLTFRIHIMAFGGEGSDISKDDVAKVAEEQAKKVMDGLKA